MNPLKKLSIKLDDQVWERDAEEELKIDVNNIDQEFQDQPGKFAWWATLESLAEYNYLQKKRIRKEKEAEQYMKLRKLYETSGKRVTEKQLEAQIALDPEVKACVLQEIEAQKQFSILSAITQAFRQRKDMLVSLGSNLRTEMKDVKLLKDQIDV